jgi:polar amino acid transport system substrate-binding protein
MGTTTVTAVFETDENYGFAAALDNTDLIDALNELLAEMQADGRYDALYSKYFS